MATVMAIKKKEFRLLAAKITENVEAAVGFAKKNLLIESCNSPSYLT